MAADEEAEAAILAEFLPEQLTEAELETLVRARDRRDRCLGTRRHWAR